MVAKGVMTRAVALLLLMMAASGLAAATLDDVPDYLIGDVAEKDIISPSHMVVLNPEATRVLKEREAARVAPIFRFHTNAVEEAEQQLRQALAGTREVFLRRLQASFKSRSLDETTLASPRFDQFVTDFQRQNKRFPVSTNLARLWARGESDRVPASSYAAMLREAMRQPVRPAVWPSEAKNGTAIRVVEVGSLEEELSLLDVDTRGRLFQRSNTVVLARAREAILGQFPPVDQAAGKFVAGLVRTNLVLDLDLTHQARHRRVGALWAADTYQPGQLIVRKGQVIDEARKAALEQLRDRRSVALLKTELQSSQVRAAKARARLPFWLGGGALATVLLALGAWWLGRRRTRPSLLPARLAGSGDVAAVVSCPSCSEKVVIPATATLTSGEGMRPGLAALLRDRVFRRLLWQQKNLLDAHSAAAREIAEMEARLEKVHAPLQERLRAYEERIAELEKELTLRGEENKELIKLKIQLARSQLAAARSSAELN